MEKSKIKSTIIDHSEFKKFSEKIQKIFFEWKTKNAPLLYEIKIGTNPKELVSIISENILEKFSKLQLIDKYDIYQILMNFWNEEMQDGWNRFHPRYPERSCTLGGTLRDTSDPLEPTSIPFGASRA